MRASKLLRGTDFFCGKCGAAVVSDQEFNSNVVEKITKIIGGIPKEFIVMTTTEGTWALRNEDERSVLDTMTDDSDRAAALVIGSMIESRLEDAIKARLIDDQDILERLFRPSGPLGPFS
jgi:hypothetical protein